MPSLFGCKAFCGRKHACLLQAAVQFAAYSFIQLYGAVSTRRIPVAAPYGGESFLPGNSLQARRKVRD